MKPIGPFMKVFGSKWGASRKHRYPAPKHNTIYEPFAGGAGYSCTHYDKNVILRESCFELSKLWGWLINTAKPSDIAEIPILKPGTNILEIGLTEGQALLAKWWQRTNNHSTITWVTSSWCNKPGQWTANTRARISEEVEAIKHWKVGEHTGPCTVFCDPPYQFNYRYGQPSLDYQALAKEMKAAKKIGSQVIVCEAVGKNGELPKYLPFKESHSQVTSRRKATQSNHSKELICLL